MMKCTICGKRFSLKKEFVYNVVINQNEMFKFNGDVIFDAMDCPNCGCQHLLKERKLCKDEKALKGNA